MEKAILENVLFEKFNEGELRLPGKTVAFKGIAWSKHPTFEGVELKHIITAKETGGTFSYHLVRIAPNKSIKTHIHETQLETHEVMPFAQSGKCFRDFQGCFFAIHPIARSPQLQSRRPLKRYTAPPLNNIHRRQS